MVPTTLACRTPIATRYLPVIDWASLDSLSFARERAFHGEADRSQVSALRYVLQHPASLAQLLVTSHLARTGHLYC